MNSGEPLAETTISQAVSVLQAGGVVAAATESSFGLLCSTASPNALDRLFHIKPRDVARGVGVIVPSLDAWLELVSPPPNELMRLAGAFWPGALTIVAPAVASLDPRLVVAGQLAARVPGSSPAAQIVAAFNGPLTATSANLTGEPPCVRASEVREVFSRQLAAGELHLHVADAPGGAPSTFVSWVGGRVSVIREGAVSTTRLQAALNAELPVNTGRLQP